jgi:hypothetical protein
MSFIFKDEAFDIGEEIAEVITKQNPKPMKLKFEKVSCSFFAQLCSYLLRRLPCIRAYPLSSRKVCHQYQFFVLFLVHIIQ